MTLDEALRGIVSGAPDHRIVLLSLVMVAAGFISGLIGFGFSFVGALALFVFAPKELFPLLLLLSLVTQSASIWSLRRSMVPLRYWWSDGPLPFIAGAALGVPAGIWLLYNLDPQALCEMVGFIVVGYTVWSFLAKSRNVTALFPMPGRVLTGVLGGVIGGFTAAPGSAVAIWGTLTGISKEQQRAIVQPFIACTQLIALVDQMIKPGGVPVSVAVYAAALSVVVVAANLLGVRVFRGITDDAFKRAVLVLLFGMGIALINKGFHVWGELFMSWHSGHPQFNAGKA